MAILVKHDVLKVAEVQGRQNQHGCTSPMVDDVMLFPHHSSLRRRLQEQDMGPRAGPQTKPDCAI